MRPSVREPAVAGTFYPGRAAELERQLDHLIPARPDHHRLLACVAPHAGYVYSGAVAGGLFGHLELPRRVLVMGPNHTGIGARVAAAPDDAWGTPIGPQPLDRDLALRLAERYPGVAVDSTAHRSEHSIEVQLPFLTRRRPDIQVLPLCLKHLGLDECLALGEAIAEVAEELDEPLGIVASSDMSHFVPDDEARTLDHRAIDAMLARDPRGLYETVHRDGISMCGVVPATVAITAANLLGAISAHLTGYATSGDASGDYRSVVGYAGICIHA